METHLSAAAHMSFQQDICLQSFNVPALHVLGTISSEGRQDLWASAPLTPTLLQLQSSQYSAVPPLDSEQAVLSQTPPHLHLPREH